MRGSYKSDLLNELELFPLLLKAAKARLATVVLLTEFDLEVADDRESLGWEE